MPLCLITRDELTGLGCSWNLKTRRRTWRNGLCQYLQVSLTGGRCARLVTRPGKGKIHLMWTLLYSQVQKFHSFDSTSSVELICSCSLAAGKQTRLKLASGAVQKKQCTDSIYKPVTYTSDWLEFNTTQRVPLLLCFCLSASAEQQQKIISAIFFIEILLFQQHRRGTWRGALTAAARSVV